MAFKMKGHTLPGIKQRQSTKMADGRPSSSPLQAKDEKLQKQWGDKRRLTSDEMKKRKINPKKGVEYYIDNKGGLSTVTTLKSSPAKAYGHKSPAKKELIGDQKNLPEELKAKIEAAPGKMYGKKSPAKQTKFPNSPGAKKRKAKKALEKKIGITKRKGNWQPALPGADHSKEELKKMTKKQKEDYYN